MHGIVYKSTGNEFLVKTTSKKLYKCKLKGRFRTYDIKSTNPVSVGDNVKFHVSQKITKLLNDKKLFTLQSASYTP